MPSPGQTVRVPDGREGMYDGPCNCSDHKAPPGHVVVLMFDGTQDWVGPKDDVTEVD
jgi:hypothetical protein